MGLFSKSPKSIEALTPEVQDKLMRLPPQLIKQAQGNPQLFNKLVELAESKTEPSTGGFSKFWRKFQPTILNTAVTAGTIGGLSYAVNAFGGDKLDFMGYNANGGTLPKEEFARKSLERAGIVAAFSGGINVITSAFTSNPQLDQEMEMEKQLWAMMHNEQHDAMPQRGGTAYAHSSGFKPGFTPAVKDAAAHGAAHLS